MLAGRLPDRDEAARLLGVSPRADEATVRRAFRLWAAWAHPDQGGSADTFRQLCAARDALLRSSPASRQSRVYRAAPTPPVHPTAGESTVGQSAAAESHGPRPRSPWSQVLARPSYPVLLALIAGGVASMLSILAATALALPWGVIPAALTSALWCVALSRAVLSGPDHGHVIVTRTLGWTVVTAGQLGIAMLAGIRVIEVLPVLALPFVLAIAAVNPAAGLWRGVTR